MTPELPPPLSSPPPAPASQGLAIAGALVLGGLPILLFVVLNFMRPDLMRPMLDHVFGYVWVAAVTSFTVGSTGLYLVGALVRFQRRTPRVILALGGLACTLPALLLVLFGPIVFAFMYGNVGG